MSLWVRPRQGTGDSQRGVLIPVQVTTVIPLCFLLNFARHTGELDAGGGSYDTQVIVKYWDKIIHSQENSPVMQVATLFPWK